MSEVKDESARELLERAGEKVQQEAGRIQIQGKALTDAEKRRLDKLGRAFDLINQALDELGGDEDTPNW